MSIAKIPFEKTGLFSRIFTDYISEEPRLREFYRNFPDLKGFENQIESRKLESEKRKILYDALKNQYGELSISSAVQKNIELLLKENTFTITTGHQLNIFTGPLYFIYKIVTVINACEKMNREFPDKHFVPVYWMASEDHDFEEIQSFNLYGKKYTWESDQKGAVGRFDPSTIKKVLDEMPGENGVFHEAYLDNQSLSRAVRQYVNQLFGEKGLVVVDGDDKDLKSLFKSYVKKELLEKCSFKLVNEQSEKLKSEGYRPQINSREINLFFLEDNLRERIVEEDGEFRILNSSKAFSTRELMSELEDFPDKFSPNVILRPVYQEVILPNVAYVGGPAEVAYWLQLKTVFETFDVEFPILLPRNFALYIDHVSNRKKLKAGISNEELFMPLDEVEEIKIRSDSDHDIDLSGYSAKVIEMFKAIEVNASNVDSTLKQLVEAEKTRSLRGIDKIQKKIIKAEKRKNEDLTGQIQDVFDRLYPKGKQQERYLNFLNFYQDDKSFIDRLYKSFDPLDLSYHIIINDDQQI